MHRRALGYLAFAWVVLAAPSVRAQGLDRAWAHDCGRSPVGEVRVATEPVIAYERTARGEITYVVACPSGRARVLRLRGTTVLAHGEHTFAVPDLRAILDVERPLALIDRRPQRSHQVRVYGPRGTTSLTEATLRARAPRFAAWIAARLSSR